MSQQAWEKGTHFPPSPPPAGESYRSWLSSACAALEHGSSNFIERDVDTLGQLLDPVRLWPLLTKAGTPN